MIENLSNAVFGASVLIVPTKDFAEAIFLLTFVLVALTIFIMLMLNSIRSEIAALREQLKDGTVRVIFSKKGLE